MRISDWSSDVCSSDLIGAVEPVGSVPQGLLMRRAAFLLPLLILAACKEEPDFDTRYDKAAKEIEARAKAMDAEIAKANADAGTADEGEEKRSEEHTSELQSLMRISYAVFCLKKKNKHQK